MKDLLIIIPAIKKNAVIPDQLIRKLNGVTLIQRAINTAKSLVSNKAVLVITDSHEISLICERNSVNCSYNSNISFDSSNLLDVSRKASEGYKKKNILIYRANAPLVSSAILQEAYTFFLSSKLGSLISVKAENKTLFKAEEAELLHQVNISANYYEEVKAFYFYSKQEVINNKNNACFPFVLNDEVAIEIDGYQSWWVCEKILQRKRIVFHVIGNNQIGMGHIYHSLALAHEITDHEVIFICDRFYEEAVSKIAAMDYEVVVCNDVMDSLIELKPDLVINDVLNTDQEFVVKLKDHGVKIVNFEDLGDGSKYADIVFNELYDEPQRVGDNYKWGYEYLALRDEFYSARPNVFTENVKEILLTFGGTDQNNLSFISLKAVLPCCLAHDIKINIVCGGGYLYKNELKSFISDCGYKGIELHVETGTISKIMEASQLAICSNGRTVYELTDMNIPSIIISHHQRESTHSFASLEKGFINLGVIDDDTEKLVANKFEKLVVDHDYRKLLFLNMSKYTFRENKKKVVEEILGLL